MISNLNGLGSVQVHQKKAGFTGSQFGFGSTPWYLVLFGKGCHHNLYFLKVDNKTQVRISKTLQTKLQKANRAPGGGSSTITWGGKTSIRDRGSGTASSVAFTPLKGKCKVISNSVFLEKQLIFTK